MSDDSTALVKVDPSATDLLKRISVADTVEPEFVFDDAAREVEMRLRDMWDKGTNPLVVSEEYPVTSLGIKGVKNVYNSLKDLYNSTTSEGKGKFPKKDDKKPQTRTSSYAETSEHHGPKPRKNWKKKGGKTRYAKRREQTK
jgi:hypothetical protein